MDTKAHNKKHIAYLSVGVLATFFVGYQYIHASWSTPTQDPTGGNVITPLNVSSSSQGKAGSLGIGTASPSLDLDVVGRVTIHPSGTGADNAYNGSLVITQPQASGQYINLIRSGTRVWSIGTIYNSSTFAIGGGQATDSNFTPSLSIETNGQVGIGTNTPDDKLDVAGRLRILTDSNPIRFTSGWSNFPNANRAEISNDTGSYKTLMIVGNRSAGAERRVDVWDRLEVNGKLHVSSRLTAGTPSTANSGSYVLTKNYMGNCSVCIQCGHLDESDGSTWRNDTSPECRSFNGGYTGWSEEDTTGDEETGGVRCRVLVNCP